MLTLKQARRMVTKSRRRVWRLCRAAGVTATLDRGMAFNGHALMLASTIAWAGTPAERDAATRLCKELYERMDALGCMEALASERARAGHRAHELPALDHGQDGDELLQDIADYYAESQPCRVCGAEMDWLECDHCGGEGGRDNDALMEEDPLWYDGVEWERCTECDGKGGWWQCYQDHSNVQ